MIAGKAGAAYCRGFAFGGRLERYRRPLAGVAYCCGSDSGGRLAAARLRFKSLGIPARNENAESALSAFKLFGCGGRI